MPQVLLGVVRDYDSENLWHSAQGRAADFPAASPLLSQPRRAPARLALRRSTGSGIHIASSSRQAPLSRPPTLPVTPASAVSGPGLPASHRGCSPGLTSFSCLSWF